MINAVKKYIYTEHCTESQRTAAILNGVVGIKFMKNVKVKFNKRCKEVELSDIPDK